MTATGSVSGPRARVAGGPGLRTSSGTEAHPPSGGMGTGGVRGQPNGKQPGVGGSTGAEEPKGRRRLSWHIPAAVLLLLLGVLSLSGAGRAASGVVGHHPSAEQSKTQRQQLKPAARLAGAGLGAGLSGATRLRSGAGGSSVVAGDMQGGPAATTSTSSSGGGVGGSSTSAPRISQSGGPGANSHSGVVLLPKGGSGGTAAGFSPPGFHCIPPERATSWVNASAGDGNPKNAHRRLEQVSAAPAPGNTSSSKGRSGSKTAGISTSSSSDSGGGPLTIALVNDVSFHDEVTLGLAAALQRHRSRLRVYLNPAALKTGAGGRGLAAYFRSKLPGTEVANAYDKPRIAPADVAVLVSPEFNVDYAREFIAAARPRLLVVFIHEPNMAMNRLRYLVSLHPLTAIATLSPHVADALSHRLNGAHVHWMLPTVPAGCDAGCAEGFAVQGKFEATRRTYDALWTDLLQLAPSANTTSAAPFPHVNIVGSGKLSALRLPKELSGSVAVYSGLPYAPFFDTLCRSIAILPLFNEASGYLKDKISSSVLASLAAGTPLLVPKAFLKTYSYLKPEHVLLMEPGESEAAAMARLMTSPGLPATISSRRAAVERLRCVLNDQAAAKMDGLIAVARGRPRHAGKYPPGGGGVRRRRQQREVGASKDKQPQTSQQQQQQQQQRGEPPKPVARASGTRA